MLFSLSADTLLVSMAYFLFAYFSIVFFSRSGIVIAFSGTVRGQDHRYQLMAQNADLSSAGARKIMRTMCYRKNLL